MYVIIVLIAFAANAMISCEYAGTCYNDFKTIPDGKWLAGEPVEFANLPFDSIATGQNTLKLNIRHDNNYPYRNLWLFIDYIDDKKNRHTDTVEYQLSDIYGKWDSRGFGSVYEFSAPIKPNGTDLNQIKSIVVWQGMRCDTLTGISEIGISLD